MLFTFDVFCNELVKRMPGFVVTTVKKDGGNSYVGLSRKRDGGVPSPILPLENYYLACGSDDALRDIIGDIICDYEQIECEKPQFPELGTLNDLASLVTVENCKIKIYDADVDREKISDKLRKEVAGIALVPFVEVSADDEGSYVLLITEEMSDILGISGSFIDDVMARLPEIYPPNFGSMESYLFGKGISNVYTDAIDYSEIANILTADFDFGAVSLFYPGVLEKLHDAMGDFYISLFDTNAVIITPKSGPATKDQLESLLVMQDDEFGKGSVLSTKVFEYDGELK